LIATAKDTALPMNTTLKEKHYLRNTGDFGATTVCLMLTLKARNSIGELMDNTDKIRNLVKEINDDKELEAWISAYDGDISKLDAARIISREILALLPEILCKTNGCIKPVVDSTKYCQEHLDYINGFDESICGPDSQEPAEKCLEPACGADACSECGACLTEHNEDPVNNCPDEPKHFTTRLRKSQEPLPQFKDIIGLYADDEPESKEPMKQWQIHLESKTKEEFYTKLRTLIPEDLFERTKESQEPAKPAGKFVQNFRKFLVDLGCGDDVQWEDMSNEACEIIEAAEKVIEQMKDLLAVIHRDGGHHTANVGLDQSMTDARVKVNKWKFQSRELAEAKKVYDMHREGQ